MLRLCHGMWSQCDRLGELLINLWNISMNFDTLSVWEQTIAKYLLYCINLYIFAFILHLFCLDYISHYYQTSLFLWAINTYRGLDRGVGDGKVFSVPIKKVEPGAPASIGNLRELTVWNGSAGEICIKSSAICKSHIIIIHEWWCLRLQLLHVNDILTADSEDSLCQKIIK